MANKTTTKEQSDKIIAMHQADYDFEQISLEVGVSVSTVKRVLSRAKLIYVSDAMPQCTQTMIRHLRTLGIDSLTTLRSAIDNGKKI